MNQARLSWSHAVAGSFLVAGSILVACGSKQDTPPPDPQVTYGQYCTRTGAAFCNCIGVAVPACQEAFQITCLAGRDANAMTERTESQTATCEAALSQRCTSVATGQLPPECPGLAPPVPGIAQ
ncbi:MAG: hypothetical protein HOW73_46030 [Polyangiaceae bacterium]|nr:hypothetical protein [Polyangiaceae bacterium]